MSDRLVNREGYTLVIEETNLTSILYQMFESISIHVQSQENLLDDLAQALPSLAGLDFIIISYYDSFVSPSNLEGYTLVGLQPFPQDPRNLDRLREIFLQADDEELCRILLMATSNDATEEKQKQLFSEAKTIIDTRISHLRRL